MEKPCLNDEDRHPDDEVLSRSLGDARRAWDSFLGLIQESYPAFSGEWRYYKDGGSWLYKIAKKKKTVCWVSVYPGLFKTGFYFPDRAEDFIKASELQREYVDQFVHGKRYGKIRAVTVTIKSPADLSATRILIEIKERVK
jgi:hypothetical protein